MSGSKAYVPANHSCLSLLLGTEVKAICRTQGDQSPLGYSLPPLRAIKGRCTTAIGDGPPGVTPESSLGHCTCLTGNSSLEGWAGVTVPNLAWG